MAVHRQRPLLTLLILTAVVSAGPALASGDPVFANGFEAGDPCDWTVATRSPVAEGEALGARTNDDLPSAKQIDRCTEVEGAIGSILADEADFDIYRFDAAAPFLLRITLEDRDESSDFEPYGDLDDDATLPLRAALPDMGPDTTTRQIWIPGAGGWYLFVSDARNWDRFAAEPIKPAAAGGADATYRLRFEVDPIVAPDIFPSFEREPLSIPADGSLIAYSFITGCDIVAETWAERLGSPSALDTRLLLVSEESGIYETVTDNDDLSVAVLDSRIEATPPASAHFFLLIDFVDSYAAAPALPAPFELDLSLTICP